jgi:hypothetical protein
MNKHFPIHMIRIDKIQIFILLSDFYIKLNYNLKSFLT